MQDCLVPEQDRFLFGAPSDVGADADARPDASRDAYTARMDWMPESLTAYTGAGGGASIPTRLGDEEIGLLGPSGLVSSDSLDSAWL